MEPEPDLSALHGAPPPTETPPDLDSLFDAVQMQMARARTQPANRLREQPTVRRRLLGAVTAASVLLAVLLTGRREDWSAYPPALLTVTLGSVGVLVALSIVLALRPVYRPPPPRWQTLGLVALSVVATCTLAVAPELHAHVVAQPEPSALLLAHASPCLVSGILLGLPVYAALRVLDQTGHFVPRFLAASAAGLVGDMALEVHCPLGGSTHLLLGHAGVVVAYLAGVLALEWVARRWLRPDASR